VALFRLAETETTQCRSAIIQISKGSEVFVGKECTDRNLYTNLQIILSGKKYFSTKNALMQNKSQVMFLSILL
jgi:hypothetical protein